MKQTKEQYNDHAFYVYKMSLGFGDLKLVCPIKANNVDEAFDNFSKSALFKISSRYHYVVLNRNIIINNSVWPCEKKVIKPIKKIVTKKYSTV